MIRLWLTWAYIYMTDVPIITMWFVPITIKLWLHTAATARLLSLGISTGAKVRYKHAFDSLHLWVILVSCSPRLKKILYHYKWQISFTTPKFDFYNWSLYGTTHYRKIHLSNSLLMIDFHLRWLPWQYSNSILNLYLIGYLKWGWPISLFLPLEDQWVLVIPGRGPCALYDWSLLEQILIWIYVLQQTYK